jgi:hypothetical protein
MRKYSYESILRAVGRVLDQAEARRFTVRDLKDGIAVETFDDQDDPSLALRLGIPELAQLLDWAEATAEQPHYERASASDEGTLHHFLQRQQRELVGAR